MRRVVDRPIPRLLAGVALIAVSGACASGPGPTTPYWRLVATAGDSTGTPPTTCSMSISDVFGNQSDGTSWTGRVRIGFERRRGEPNGTTIRDTALVSIDYPVQVTVSDAVVVLVLNAPPFRDTLVGSVYGQDQIRGTWTCDSSYPSATSNPPAAAGSWLLARLYTID